MEKKKQRAATSEQGVVFPLDKQGKRPSTAIVKKIMAGTVADIYPNLADSIIKEKKWRSTYPKYVHQINTTGIQTAQNALTIARKGLETAYKTMRFVRDDKETDIDTAMAAYTKPVFHTGIINGQSPHKGNGHFSMPFQNKILFGDHLEKQVDKWEQQGIFEVSFARALRNIISNKEWADLSGKYFVLMGAGSEVGPFQTLLKLGATVIAIDLERPDIWQRLIRTARQSSGKLIMPLKEPFSDHMSDNDLARMAGADLACHAPEIRTWLLEMDCPMTIGAYAYADGARHIRVAMAMDAIIKDITGKRNDTVIAFLLTPSDSFVVPEEVAAETGKRFRERSGLSSTAVRFFTRGNMFYPHAPDKVISDNGKIYGLSDNIILQQGPGYILAKNIQKWRSLVARNNGVRVSSNVAPATITRSVFNNKILAAGYAGLAYFNALAFTGKTTNAMMTAALINDLNDKESPANPEKELTHPLELFMECANHGGLWRIAYQPRSVLLFSVCLGIFQAIKQKFSSGTALVRTSTQAG